MAAHWRPRHTIFACPDLVPVCQFLRQSAALDSVSARIFFIPLGRWGITLELLKESLKSLCTKALIWVWPQLPRIHEFFVCLQDICMQTHTMYADSTTIILGGQSKIIQVPRKRTYLPPQRPGPLSLDFLCLLQRWPRPAKDIDVLLLLRHGARTSEAAPSSHPFPTIKGCLRACRCCNSGHRQPDLGHRVPTSALSERNQL